MKILFCFLAFFFGSCHGQEMNKKGVDEKTGNPMLLGYCDRSAFLDTTFGSWFYTQYEAAEVDLDVLDELSAIDKSDLQIKIAGGSWCSDTKKQLPSFLFILDQINFPKDKYVMLMVDRSKKSEDENIEEWNIQFVPTFIIFKNEKEIGRIIESPQISLEKDLLDILKGNQN